MKKFLLSLICMLGCCAFGLNAQVFTATPTPLQNSSKNVVITYHGDVKDSKGTPFKGTTNDLYVHIGLYTDKATGGWAYRSSWGDNKDKYLLKYKSTDTWELTIGDMHTYFGVPENETITKICIIARNAAATAQTADNFIEVSPDGFQMQFYASQDNLFLSKATEITFTMNVSRSSALDISVNGKSIGTANGTTLTKSYNFTSTGAYEVVATAKDGNETISETLHVLYTSPSPQANYPGGTPKMGAVRAANGDVTFCIAAPGKTTAVMVPSWDDYAPLGKNVMKYQDYQGNRYFWITVSGLDPDKQYPYYYNIDGISVGDPYANLVLDPYSDKWLDKTIWPDMPQYPYDKLLNNEILAVYHANQHNFNWTVKDFQTPSMKSMTIYEICLRDFTGKDYTDDGTLRKAIEKIPYLSDLGVNCVELMPVMEFNGNNSWGYNTNFYMALDKAYGSPADLAEFVDKCHAKGIAVVLDIVFNQSDGLHPWYMLYPAASNPFYNAVAPHAYSVLNDWKQENELVRQQWKDAVTYWMTNYKVDGFRFDLTKGLGDSNSYANASEGITNGFIQSRVDNLKRISDVIFAINPNAIHINEHLGDYKEENAFFANGQHSWNNQNYNSSAYAAGEKTNGELRYFSSAACSRTAGAFVSYAESHDEERVGFYQASSTNMKNKTHEERMRRLGSVACWLLLVNDATPMIWQFGELGADESIQANGDRVNTKKVLWSYLEDEDRSALMGNYQALIHLRKDNPQVFEASNTTYSTNSSAAKGPYYIRFTNGSSDIIAVLNPSLTGTANVSTGLTNLVDAPANYYVVTASKGFSAKLRGSQASASVTGIPAGGFAVFASKAVAEVTDVNADSALAPAASIDADGNVCVAGPYTTLRVYDVMGRSVGTTGLSSGIYIVEVDGIATKLRH